VHIEGDEWLYTVFMRLSENSDISAVAVLILCFQDCFYSQLNL